MSAEYDETAGVVYEAPPPDDGIAILEGVVATEFPAGDEPPTADLELPKPEWNQPVAPPQPVPAGPGPGGHGPGGISGGRPPGSIEQAPASAADGGAAAGTDGQPERLGIRDLPPDVQMRLWRWRVLIMVVVGVVFTILTNWAVGLTLAILAGIADTIYRSRTAANIPTGGSQAGAQRRTRRQLARMRRAGYLTLDARPIPNSREVIDHLVIGPTGVYAIDSEKWHKSMPIRTRNGKQLWHGPDSKKQRLEHASWEARQASDVLSAALRTEIVVRPAMAIYGPKVPWNIATIRDVDVFSGPALRKYLRRRARSKTRPQLTREQVRTIYETAGKVLPDVAPTRTVTPVG